MLCKNDPAMSIHYTKLLKAWKETSQQKPTRQMCILCSQSQTGNNTEDNVTAYHIK